MESTHIPIEAVRAYLLGDLDDVAAAALEERYFVDRSFFKEVQAAERALIQEYVAGRMPPVQGQRFESRYLQIPHLRLLVDEVRRERDRSRQPAFSMWPRLAFAALLLCAVATSVVVYWMHRQPVGPSITAQTLHPPAAHPMVSLRLAPGPLKGGNSTDIQLTLPPSAMPVHLTAELPGITSPVDCTGELSIIEPDGHWTKAWKSSQPVRSIANDGGQAVTFVLDSSALHPGDYVLEVAASGHRIRETYVFRAIRHLNQ